MVKGLEIFRAWFVDYKDQYVLIGGTAASIAMETAGSDFRQTKDLDVVLHLEALTPQFGKQFWAFIEAGGYAIRQSSTTGKPQLYRFVKPLEEDFPYMVELFARAPIEIDLAVKSHLTPIPISELASSLSAILLGDIYYDFVMAGRREQNGLTWVGEDRLIPLKAIAWLELTNKKANGEQIDSRDIRKHLRDIVALAGLLSPAARVEVDEKIATDLRRFIEAVSATQVFGQSQNDAGVFERLKRAYSL
jgi:Nucleotidyl transferase AbiEii toxin, Type IV TA system